MRRFKVSMEAFLIITFLVLRFLVAFLLAARTACFRRDCWRSKWAAGCVPVPSSSTHPLLHSQLLPWISCHSGTSPRPQGWTVLVSLSTPHDFHKWQVPFVIVWLRVPERYVCWMRSGRAELPKARNLCWLGEIERKVIVASSQLALWERGWGRRSK